MKNQTALHGRDHCPGGSDPIPCLQYPDYASAEAFIPSTTAILNGGCPIGTPTGSNPAGIGEYTTMAHTNPDVFGWNGTDSIQIFARGLYIITSWIYLGVDFSKYFDMGINIEASGGLLGFWQSQPPSPDGMIKASSWSSSCRPGILRTYQYFRIWDSTPATPLVNLTMTGWLTNMTGGTKASGTHNSMDFGLEIVRLGESSGMADPIYELGSP